MRRAVFLASALVIAALPATALAGGQGVSRGCGTITITPANPKIGFPKAGPYHLNSFAPTRARLIACSTVRTTAARYVKTHHATGYTIKGYPNVTGRSFLTPNTNGKVGFQIIWTK